VIGTDVPFALMRAIAEVPEAALQRGLAHLQAAEFLYETQLFPESAYTFKHALTYEVAYGSLLHERRRALHARLVEALEALACDRLDDQVERLAHHAHRGEVWQKAVPYGRQAGDKARARSAYREVLVCYEQGLAMVERGVEQEVANARARRLALVVALLSEAYLLTGRLEEARQLPAQALDYARRYKQRGHQAWALWLLGESTARQASLAVEPAAGARLDVGHGNRSCARGPEALLTRALIITIWLYNP